MARTYHFPDDVLRIILDYVADDWDKIIPIDRRAYLSKESFVQPIVPPSEYDKFVAIGNFRRVCRRFARLGAPYQWSRITTRYSVRGFKRLDTISRRQDLVQHVRKFSLMVPYFYARGHSRIEELFHTYGIHPRHAEEDYRLDPGPLIRKRDELQALVDSGDDIASLTRAFMTFNSLQHVQVLPLVDSDDRVLLEVLRRLSGRQDFPAHLVQLEWAPACYHAVRGLGKALSNGLRQDSVFQKFSAPLLNSNSAVALVKSPQLPVSHLAERLTCLEVQFEPEPRLSEHILGLSEQFESLFKAARNMQLIHMGFPSSNPLEVRLQQIFHNVQWKHLRVFGIQAWRLDADEIVDMARRHRRTLRGLRLRDVLLNEGSLWRDVLTMLRSEMENLDWISLRRVDYAAHFDEVSQGTEIDDIDLYPSSDSSSNAEDEEMGIADDEDDINHHYNHEVEDSPYEESSSDSDDDGPAGLVGPDSPISTTTPLTSPLKSLSIHELVTASADELGDNGRSVGRRQTTKAWEQWVIAPSHFRH